MKKKFVEVEGTIKVKIKKKVCGVPLGRNTSSGTGRGLDCGCHDFSKISMYHKNITLNRDL